MAQEKAEMSRVDASRMLVRRFLRLWAGHVDDGDGGNLFEQGSLADSRATSATLRRSAEPAAAK